MKIAQSQQDKFYIYPPDLDKSQKHYLATRIFKGINEDNLAKQCQCCQRKIGNQQQPCHCCYGNLQLGFLGPGVPLFFTFLRNVIIYLIILCIIFSIFGLFSNLRSNDCQSSQSCAHNIFNTLSIVNKINQLDYLSIQNYILLAFVIISIFLLQIFRYNFRKVEEQCDDLIDSPSDYAIIIRRLPKNVTKADIEKMIQFRRSLATQQEKHITDNFRIVNIVLSYHLTAWIKAKQQNIQQFKKHAKSQNSNERFKPKELPVGDKTGTFAIVIFAKQQTKQLLIEEGNIFQKLLYLACAPCVPKSDFTVKDQYVAIQRAPQPDDIIWQSASVSLSGSIFRKTIWNIVTTILLIIGAIIQFGLALGQKNFTNNTHAFILSTFSSILVSITNAILQQFIIFSTYRERAETQSQLYKVLTIKISFFQFLNAGVFIVIAKIFANISNFSIEGQLASEVTQIMIINAITPSIGTFLLYYFNIFGKIKRFLIKKKVLTKTQIEANIDWEAVLPQIPYKYSYIIKTIWLTAFYAPLAPIVVPISISGLTGYYIVERILYGNAYRAPNMLSAEINNSAVELLQWFILILSFGQFLVYFYFKAFNIDAVPASWSSAIFVSLGISIISILLPMGKINKKIIKLPSDSCIYPSYDVVQEKFEVTYEMSNPIAQSRRKRKRDRFLWHALFGHHNNAIQMPNLFNQNTSKGLMKQPLVNNNSNYINNSNNSGNLFQALGAGIQHQTNHYYSNQLNSYNGYQPNFKIGNNYNQNYKNNYPNSITYDPPPYGADQYIQRGISANRNQSQNQPPMNAGNPFTQLLNYNKDRL